MVCECVHYESGEAENALQSKTEDIAHYKTGEAVQFKLELLSSRAQMMRL